jgi:hypothetical protein
VLVLPCKAVAWHGHTKFDFNLDFQEPRLHPLLWELNNFVAYPVQWRSWIWQFSTAPAGGTGQTPRRIALFGKSIGPMPLFKLACHSAFWGLSRTFVVQVADDAGIECEKGASLFDTLFHVISTGLAPMSDDQVLDVIAARLHVSGLRDAFADALLQIDEAIDVFDHDDHKKVREEQEATKVLKAEKEEILSHYRAKRAAVRTRREAAAPKARGKAKAKAAPARLKWPSEVSQADAAKLIPEGSSIWRGLTKRVWCGHHPPARRISAPWDGPGGETAALRSVVQRLWQTHIDHWGLADNVAPEGLFDEVV